MRFFQFLKSLIIFLLKFLERKNFFMFISEIQTEAPKEFKTDLQRKVYEVLNELHIPFERVDTDEVITMEDCELVDQKLNMKMVKTLFLCNRQHTEFYLFYLFITAGDKRFNSKGFSTALDIARVSFAPEEKMLSMLGTTIGAATVFSALLPSTANVRIIFDREVVNEEYYGCSDGTTTGYMKIKTALIVNDFMKYAGRSAKIISIPR